MSATEPTTPTEKTPAITLRLPEEMLKRIERAGRGVAVSRAETIRQVLKIGLDMVEGPR